MAATLCIHNERAGRRLSAREQTRLFAQIEAALGDIEPVKTSSPNELPALLQGAMRRGCQRVIALGGDGTAHYLINALMEIRAAGEADSVPAFGLLPLGTGCDWSRGIGQPLERQAALAWLARARARPIDIGECVADTGRRYYLNIASCGLSGEVARRAQQLRRKQSWTYLTLTMQALAHFQRSNWQVEVDGQIFYDGQAALIAACNGSHFGRGMRIAPESSPEDGQLSVLLARRLNHFSLLRLSPSLFLGQSFGRGALLETSGREIRVTGAAPFAYEMDGEAGETRALQIRLHPGALRALLA